MNYKGKEVKMQIQTGDFFLEEIDELPEKVEETDTKVFGRGEVMDHFHCVEGEGVTLLKDEDHPLTQIAMGEIGFARSIGEANTVTHVDGSGAVADHQPKPLLEGTYVIVKQRQYDYLTRAIINIQD